METHCAVSIPDKTSYLKISWNLKVMLFVFRIIRLLWNVTGTSVALLSMCLSNFKAMQWFKLPISHPRDPRLIEYWNGAQHFLFRHLLKFRHATFISGCNFWKWSSNTHGTYVQCLDTSLIGTQQHGVPRHKWHLTVKVNGNIFRGTGPLWGNPPLTLDSPHKGQWRAALVFSLICAWTNA